MYTVCSNTATMIEKHMDDLHSSCFEPICDKTYKWVLLVFTDSQLWKLQVDQWAQSTIQILELFWCFLSFSSLTQWSSHFLFSFLSVAGLLMKKKKKIGQSKKCNENEIKLISIKHVLSYLENTLLFL